MTPLAFRFATTADIPAVVALVESAYRGESSHAGWTTEAGLLGGQRTDAGVVEESLAQPGVRIVLAFQAERLVACCELHAPGGPGSDGAHGMDDTLAEHPCTPGDAGPRAAYFGMFAVTPTLQGAGVGRQVLAEAERIARDDFGADRLQMTVIQLRTELLDWYERRGYRRTGEEKPFPYGDERFGLPRRDDIKLLVLERLLTA